MKLPSASKIELATQCLHPFTSGTPWPEDGGSGVYANFGNAVHACADMHVRGEPYELQEVARVWQVPADDVGRLCTVVATVIGEIHRLKRAGFMLWSEVPIAYNVATGKGRVMRSGGQRDYRDKRRGEVAMTIDLIAARPGHVVILDWKTGRSIEHEEKSTWQMLIAGRAVASILKAEELDLILMYVDEDGIRPDVANVDCFDLVRIADGLKELWTKLHAGPSEPRPGSWCTTHYCPLLGQCSATRAALAKYASADPILAQLWEPGNAARALEALPRAEAALKAVKDELKKIAAKGPIEGSDGTLYGMVERDREYVSLDPEDLNAMAEVIGKERAIEAVKLTTSKAAIKRAAGEDHRHVLSMLRERGALRSSTYTFLGPIKKGA